MTDNYFDGHTEQPANHPEIDGIVDSLARQHAPDVLAEALRQARRQAQAELTKRLTRALLDEAGHGETDPPDGVDGSPSPPGIRSLAASGAPAGPIEPIEQARQSLAQLGTEGVPERGLYAYGCTWDGPLDAATVRAAGGGLDLRLITHGDLALVVAEVELSRFAALSAESGEGHSLSEESELVVLARQHDAVVRVVFAQRPVLPLRFATVLPDEAAAVRLLSGYRDQARAWLQRVDGHREWGVRARPSGQPFPRVDVDAGPDAFPGSQYVPLHHDPTGAGRPLHRRGVDSARSLHETLTRYATDSVIRGERHDLLLDAAYLLPVDREKAFQAAVEQLLVDLDREGVSVEITGPWPPYSFTEFQWDLSENRMEMTHQ